MMSFFTTGATGGRRPAGNSRPQREVSQSKGQSKGLYNTSQYSGNGSSTYFPRAAEMTVPDIDESKFDRF
ncbi:hypothetical protein ACFPIJ_31030 [Dactylosporangium cerinum]|uniref:Uncharacterized protein n=1 Tax=Dactylosporangium cerinum TaxID=1434730 RepID=A0ABV9W4G0_9ACTN